MSTRYEFNRLSFNASFEALTFRRTRLQITQIAQITVSMPHLKPSLFDNPT